MPTQRATVMGLGTFGGGAGATRHLVRLGYDVTLTDIADESTLQNALKPIEDLIDSGAVMLRLGGHNVSDFTTSDVVVINPAVKLPWDNRFVRSALASGARVTTEIGLLIDALPDGATVIGITGSAGKSTTSAMIHAGLQASDIPSILGGNIGVSLLDRLDTITTDTTVVLELSSAMLWWLDQPGTNQRTPLDIALVTNIEPNHIDWHGSLEHYTQSKRSILDRVRKNGHAVLHHSLRSWPRSSGVAFEYFSDCFPNECLQVPGEHNQTNAAGAYAACIAAGADPKQAAGGISAFPGLPHRLEFIAEINGVRWYNDSKSTTPSASRLAVDALKPAPIHLIVGGSDKGIDLGPIADLRHETQSLLCIGQTGTTIAKLANTEPSDTLEQAVQRAAAEAKPGECVVLSPGCASYDQFDNFEHRGRCFAELVHSLA
ncbi:MAG TPA: UDP-N-acetylmuramoyl-L-alanine--D-glutamate ligase [Phycisphaerales bacterium]|nr:UDP-N-acetylmuramoyl-L-alanine--D-glutamate ligase [Phycisphaerales bacterium]